MLYKNVTNVLRLFQIIKCRAMNILVSNSQLSVFLTSAEKILLLVVVNII